MASVSKRPDSKWRARYRDPENKEHAKHFDRKVDAERWLVDQQQSVNAGTWIDPRKARQSLAEYAEAWLARMTPTWRPGTGGAVKVSLQSHIIPALGERPLASITRADVEAFAASLKLAPSSVGTVHQHLSQLLGAAVEDGLLSRNVASRARLPKREASRAQPVPLEVVERIAEELPDWLRVAVPLGVGVGLRQGEASGLALDRVDFLRRTLRVDQQLLSRYVDQPTLAPPKTASSHRTVPLAQFVVDALADHLRRYPAQPGELVLRMPTGEPVDSDRFGHQWRPACKRAGVPGLRYHDLRHTFASTLLSRGVSVKAVGSWLGHASPVITLSTYAHLMPADEEVARAVLDESLGLRPNDGSAPVWAARTEGGPQTATGC
jgi:integrase